MVKFYNILILMILNVNKEFFLFEVEFLFNNKILKKLLVYSFFYEEVYEY